jgi:hypothetical protein
VRLARLVVGGGVTTIVNANIVNYHQIAKVGLGLNVANQAARDALLPYDGLQVKRTDTANMEYYDLASASWKTLKTVLTRPFQEAWTAYTPTLNTAVGAFTLGTGGVNDCSWRYEGELVRVRYKFVLGTSFTFTAGDPRFTLPVAAVTPAHAFAVYNGVSTITSGGAIYIVHALAASAANMVQIVLGTAPAGVPSMSATSPWTWVAGATLQGELTYRPA